MPASVSDEQALKAANKKTWNRTKRIMLCNVIAFICIALATIAFVFKPVAGFILMWIANFATMMAVTFCWELEIEL